MAENRGRPPGSLAERLGWDRPAASAGNAANAGSAGSAATPARVRTARGGRAAPGGRAQPDGRGEPIGRHCWVVDCPEAPGRWPGLLLEWTRERDGWRGRVMMIAEGELGPVTLTLWVSGEHLHPA